MKLADELVRVRSLSDDALLLGLAHSLRASRRAVADIVAHLGEVEERRLHLLGGYSSMFAYCLTRLGMSEDEAYRRIEARAWFVGSPGSSTCSALARSPCRSQSC